MTFKSRAVRKSDEGFVAVGDLTIRGVTKEIELPFVLSGPIEDPRGQTVLGVESRYRLNRHDYGVSWNRELDGGGFVVGDEVIIEIQVEAIRS